MIIYPYIPKRKPRKPNAKQRAQKASWQALLEKYDIKASRKAVQKSSWVGPTDHPVTVVDPRRSTNHIPSVDTGQGVATKKPVMQYTGDAMLGIGQLHKSNAVPIFKAQDAIDISKMRRG
jgi:hypothetical protein